MAEDKETGPKPFDTELYEKEMQEAIGRGDDPRGIVTTPEVDFSMDNIKRANPEDEEAYFRKHLGSPKTRNEAENQSIQDRIAAIMKEDDVRKERSRKHREALAQHGSRDLEIGDDTEED